MAGVSPATERRPSHAVSPPQPAAEPTPSPTKVATFDAKPTRKSIKKSKPVGERTPLIIKAPEKSDEQEAIHPLPWFRSPEMKRQSPDPRHLQRNDRRRKHRYRRGRSLERDSMCSGFVDTVCCGLVQSDAEPDLEYGEQRSDVNSDGFKRCVQCLVALIVVVAVILILIIIFEPFHEATTVW
ncbi:hypothetical protein ATCC90586_004883 [Pythium insidiosum]|nr:hypothetical protein ATCC90586_004883 [Pythium insidiosum]